MPYCMFKHITPKGNEVIYLHEIVKKEDGIHRMFEPMSVDDLLDNPSLINEIKEALKKPILKA